MLLQGYQNAQNSSKRGSLAWFLMSQDVTHLLPEALGDDLECKEELQLADEPSVGLLSWSSHSGDTA